MGAYVQLALDARRGFMSLDYWVHGFGWQQEKISDNRLAKR